MLIIKIITGILLLMIISWLGSFLVLFQFKAKSLNRFVLRCITGMFVVALLTAVLVTKFNTILIIGIPCVIILGFVFSKKQTEATDVSFLKMDGIAIVAFALIAVAIAFLNIHGNEFHGMKVPINDQTFYSTVATSIYSTNIESNIGYLSDFLNTTKLNVPYHYFEYWITYLLKHLTGWNTHLILNGIVIGYSLLLMFMSFYLILVKVTGLRGLSIVIAAAVYIALRGINVYWPEHGFNFIQATDSVFFDGNQKLLYAIPCFLIAVYYLFEETKTVGILLLLLLPAFNVLFFLSIFSGIGLYMAIQFLKHIKGHFSAYKWIYVSYFSSVIMLIIYLKFIAVGGNSEGYVKSVGGIIHNLIHTSLDWFLINGLLLLVIGYLLFKTRKQIDIALLYLCLTAGGFLCYAIFDTNQNSWQVTSSINRCVGYGMVVFIIFLLAAYKKTQLQVVRLFAIIGIVMFIENYPDINHLPKDKISSYSNDYIQSISQLRFKNKVGIKIVNVNTRPNLQRNPVYAGVCNYFALTENAITSIVINVDDLLYRVNVSDTIVPFQNYNTNLINKEILAYSPVINFYNSSNNKGSMKTIKDLQINFVESFKPEFCVIEKGNDIPDFLRQYITATIVDKGTMETFCTLNYQAINR